LRSNGTVSPAPHRTLDRTKNSDKLKQVLNQNQNQTIQNSLGQVNITYNLTSKQESETINRTRDFNLSPEAKTSEAKDLDSRNHALFSPG
jgi:UV DNA damage repair endonuclease